MHGERGRVVPGTRRHANRGAWHENKRRGDLEQTKNTYEPDVIRIFRPEDEGGYPNYYFQQDNAPAHTAGVVAKHLVDNAPNVLTPWPPCSPDLNVMDYAIGGMMDTAVGMEMKALSAKLVGAPPFLQQFIAAVNQEYDESDVAIVKKSVEQWMKRVAACAEKQGGDFEKAIQSKRLFKREPTNASIRNNN